ncbi:MAG: hypothetical protein JW804_02030 [Sedimentisphaerales bacterium]|nr:hypothetical protein [Sedimentisphaerales bacterium]
MTSYKNHIKSYNDLITPYQATRAGFIEIALEKNRKAITLIINAS